MVNKSFNKKVPYEDFELMNETTVYKGKSKNQANNKWSRGDSEGSKSDDSFDDDESLFQARNKNQVSNL